MLIPQVFVGIFTSDPELMDTAVWAARIFLFGVFSFGAQSGFQQSFLALGQAKVSLLLALLRKIVLLIPLIYILPLFFGDKLFGVFVAEPIADILAAATTTVCFWSLPRKTWGTNPALPTDFRAGGRLFSGLCPVAQASKIRHGPQPRKLLCRIQESSMVPQGSDLHKASMCTKEGPGKLPGPSFTVSYGFTKV